ncbi:MAG TPA: nucleoside triphosphate pyrophosphatase [Stellaceae bacterium]|nr:nucleoside triphosphate pyrophosphatase [Stellaceae bacterium]
MPPLILASASTARGNLLRHAGIAFAATPAAIDEDEIKAAFRADRRPAAECAIALAEAKAARVARKHPGSLIIGADQMLVCDGSWFDKPADRAAARAQLITLRGKRHELISALCVVRDGERLWHVIDRSTLTMRNFSDTFLEDYLAAVGDAVLGAVGAYHLEGLGVQLFAQIEGGYFSILGLPLLPLLDFLRGHGIVAQ